MTRSICELHRYNQTEESAAIRNLDERDFKDVKKEFIRSIYDQLNKESWRQNSNKSIYYTIVLPSQKVFRVWSKRYLLSLKDKPTDGNSYEIQVVDCYNEKSAYV